jgi:hypothetical protein
VAAYHMGCHSVIRPLLPLREEYSARKARATGKSRPMPSPIKNLNTMRDSAFQADAQAIAAPTKRTMSTMNILYRPIRSTRWPPKMAPTMAPIMIDAATTPSVHGSRPYVFVMSASPKAIAVKS